MFDLWSLSYELPSWSCDWAITSCRISLWSCNGNFASSASVSWIALSCKVSPLEALSWSFDLSEISRSAKTEIIPFDPSFVDRFWSFAFNIEVSSSKWRLADIIARSFCILVISRAEFNSRAEFGFCNDSNGVSKLDGSSNTSGVLICSTSSWNTTSVFDFAFISALSKDLRGKSRNELSISSIDSSSCSLELDEFDLISDCIASPESAGVIDVSFRIWVSRGATGVSSEFATKISAELSWVLSSSSNELTLDAFDLISSVRAITGSDTIWFWSPKALSFELEDAEFDLKWTRFCANNPLNANVSYSLE